MDNIYDIYMKIKRNSSGGNNNNTKDNTKDNELHDVLKNIDNNNFRTTFSQIINSLNRDRISFDHYINRDIDNYEYIIYHY